MSDQAKLEKFYYNGKLTDTKEFPNVYKPLQPSCYEVVRVIDGRALFLDEHYERLCKTAESIHQSIPFTLEELGARIGELAQANDVKNYNVKLILNDFGQGPDQGPNIYLFFTPTSYPSEDMYRQGVATNFLHLMRENPQAKIINQSLRDQADALMKEEGLFEAILVDDAGNITEGSKSNIFFIRGGALYTSPAEGVLLGVTRQRILRLAQENEIPVHETTIPKADIETFDAAFISGTSPKVLPIARVGETLLNVEDETLRKTMEIYDAEIKRYLSN